MKKFLHSVSSLLLTKEFFLKKIHYAYKKKNYLFIIVFLFLSAFMKSSAQIIDDGNQHHVGYTGSYQDFVVPNNPLLIKIGMHLYGADGGAARVRLVVPLIGTVLNTCNSGGGAGAFTSVVFLVGSGPGKIPYGSTLRFIIGQKGTSGQDDVIGGVGSEYGGGGGGTAVLYLPPSGSTWILLAVAGGGGGAYVGMIAGLCAITEPGGAGRESENGGDAPGIVGGSGFGGSGGGGGGSSAYGTGSGGGGATVRGGSVPCIDGDLNVHDIGEGGAGRNQLTGVEEGGYGGTSEGCTSLLLGWRNGGYGYGGGGGGVGVGGGGGGYSGGGSGTLACGGGGGGSFFHSMRDYAVISGGGNTTNPSEGFANYEVTLNQPPVAVCKNATVYLSATGAASIVTSDIDNGSNDPDGTPLTYSLSKSVFNCANVGDNNVTLTVTDNYGATATCVAIVTVIDNTFPVITCPANITVSCAALVPPVNTSSVTTIDNCPGVIVTHVSDVISNQTCTNRFTLTRTYKAKDASGNTVSCSQVITVYDNTPPVISNVSVSPASLWPPNHTMRDITLNYQLSDNCVNSPATALSVSSNEPINGTGDGDTAPDWTITDNHHVKLRAERSGNGSGRIYTITISSNDGCNATATAITKVTVPKNNSQNKTAPPETITNISINKDFLVAAFPNPAASKFYVNISGNNTKEKIMLQVYDVTGRLIETRQSVNAGSTVQLGNAYRSGVYLLRVMQGNNHKELKLVKLTD